MQEISINRKSIECALGLASHANWSYGRPHSDIIMFDVDVTRCVALFLTNILHLKPFEDVPVPKLRRKPCFATVLNRITH